MSDAAISQDARKVLRELGLADYETRAYLALLGRGALSASQISENAQVPYSKIYETLASLEGKGWVESQRGRPTKYFPKAPSEALANMKLQLEDKVKKWEKIVLDELEPLYEHREIREKPDIWILRGEFNALAKLKEMIDNTKNELMIAAPFMPQTLADSATRLFQQLSPNVKVQIMISGKTKEWNLETLRVFADVRVRDHMFGGGVIADGKEAMLFLGEDRPTLVIWANHLGLVQFAKEYFRYLWETSKKAQ